MSDKIISGPPLSGDELLARLETRMGSMKLVGERDDLLLDAAMYVKRTEDMAEAIRLMLEFLNDVKNPNFSRELLANIDISDPVIYLRAALAKAGVP